MALKFLFLITSVIIWLCSLSVPDVADSYSLSTCHQFRYIERSALYDFVTQSEMVDRWLSVVSFVATDQRPIGVGKTYKVVVDSTVVHFNITDHIPGRHIALESQINLLRPRLELWFCVNRPAIGCDETNVDDNAAGGGIRRAAESTVASDQIQTYCRSFPTRMTPLLSTGLPPTPPSATSGETTDQNQQTGCRCGSDTTNVISGGTEHHRHHHQLHQNHHHHSNLELKFYFKHNSFLFQATDKKAGPIVYHTIKPTDSSPHEVKLMLGTLYSDYHKIHVDHWRDIGDPSKKCRIFSAFYDPRLEILENIPKEDGLIPYGSIRVIAVLPLRVRGIFYCEFKHSRYRKSRQRADFVEPISEHRGLNFTASFVVCQLSYSRKDKKVFLPGEVGLSYDAEPSMINATSFIRIHYPMKAVINNPVPEHGLAVCIGPVHNNYTNALRMVEYVEYWRWQGSNRFYFYNQSATPSVHRVMNYYRRRRLAEVFDWRMEDYKHEEELRYAGIFAAINDCVYRAAFVGNFRFIAVVDLDEFIFQLEHPERPLIEFLERIDEQDVHSFHFRTVFFYSSAANLSEVPDWAVNQYLYTQVRTKRTRHPMAIHVRSKYIAKGRKVIEAGNHFVWRALQDTSEVLIPPEEGLVYHYRDQCPNYECEDLIPDRRAHRNWWMLWHAVDRSCQRIFPRKEGLCPVGIIND
ncbi:uncharacterized protein LOC129764578 [Toxorhynchites rutilus septentrionalis]|uniref:uncharacterized protein LOC129764578 n=1 Tax=Toxorhynchites rutilus septentrionalis TaxID=329112 RepID=UPI00247A9F0A|nr:uncharacterized protein LOC129764578 [Toxorhynchites rutilus septentrionalis]